MVAGRRFSGRRGLMLMTIAKRRQAEASRDHPQQEMRPEIPSAKLSPARQQSTHLRYLLLVATLRNILRPNTNINTPSRQQE